jgi:hypothetical protein
MRALELDFQRPPRPVLAGWLILVAGIATLAVLLGNHRMLAHEVAARQAAVKRIEVMLPGAGSARAQNAIADTGLMLASKAMERPRLPWDSLFSALESADDKEIALLAVTPDAARRQVKIHAEARHLAAMLAFHRRMQQDASLRDVILLDHEVFKETAEAPVRFHISAAWGADHGRP